MKVKQFWIDNKLVDLTRQQISDGSKTHNLPAKAIAVLTMLADRQGEVLLFDDILAEVWQGRVVSTNTLQRCISQIRQAFDDDSKQQKVIKTHGRKGYSLEIPLQFETIDCQPDRDLDVRQLPTAAERTKRLPILITGCLLSLTLMIWWLANNSPSDDGESTGSVTSKTATSRNEPFKTARPNQTLTQSVQPVTSSDKWESNASYSPDGTHLVFRQYIDKCNSHLWLKELSTGQEQQLTKKAAVYGIPSWSPSGKHIAFAQQNNCLSQQRSEQLCWTINTLTISHAQKALGIPKVVLNCSNNPSWQVKWQREDKLSFLQQVGDKPAAIQSFDINHQRLTTLVQGIDSDPYQYDWSVKDKELVVLSITADNQHFVSRYNEAGILIKNHPISLPSHLGNTKGLFGGLHPTARFMTVSTTDGLYNLLLNGQLNKLSSLNHHKIADISYHPSGKQFIATEITADTDNILIQSTDLGQLNERHKVARSNASEDNPSFQPGGSLIAFTSKRTGTRQLWLTDGQRERQLSELAYGIHSRRFSWSPDGKQIASLGVNGLLIWQLDGHYTKLNLPITVSEVFDWPTPQELLIKARVQGRSNLYLLNLTNSKLQLLHQNETLWATLYAGKLLFLDSQYRFFLSNETLEHSRTKYFGKLTFEPIDMLAAQLEQPFAAINGESLYGVDPQHQLWSYSFTKREKRILAKLPNNIRYLSAHQNQQFLFTQMHKLNKDLVAFKIE